MGPDLTNAISVRDTEYLKTLIRYGSGRMPNFKLSEKEVTNLVAFLAWVNESGNGSVPETSVHWSGTYIIDR